ncbi:hypothetical protein [Nocardia yamanashiensis]|uniref:hypothetical protein n=1 Tax=Nocardia yamanashiensis TaxID=209247 RepID=UPI0012FD9435|nr:hypothetical protein [Nocardia yamanashiensis]
MTKASTSGTRRWLLVFGAVLLTSAVWAGAFSTVGKPVGPAGTKAVDDPNPVADLRGYHFVDDICTVTDLTPFVAAGFVAESVPSGFYRNPAPAASVHPALDTMRCTIRFRSPGESPARQQSVTNLRVIVKLYKQSDPAPEFKAGYLADRDDQLGSLVPVTVYSRIDGLGDEAYQTVTHKVGSTSNTEMQLWIRHGWAVYGISWFQELVANPGEITLAPDSDLLAMLRKVAESTLPRLNG